MLRGYTDFSSKDIKIIALSKTLEKTERKIDMAHLTRLVHKDTNRITWDSFELPRSKNPCIKKSEVAVTDASYTQFKSRALPYRFNQN